MMLRSLFNSIFFFSAVLLNAQEEKWQLDTESSEITYSANHLLHPWKAVNKNVKGVLVLPFDRKEIKELAVLALVQDFDSKNEGRDAHALEVLESLSFPEVRFYSNIMEQKKDSLFIHGKLDFHGVVKNITIVGLKESDKDEIILSGNFEIKPTDFEIQLPSFMMVKIDDVLNFEYKLTFTK